MSADESEDSDTAIPEIARFAAQIGDAIGFSFDEAESPASSDHLNSDGAWEYHFETDERWGFVAAGLDDFLETTYPGWNSVAIQPGHWAVFYEGTFAGTVSPHGGRIGGCALLEWDDDTALEAAMLDAFRAERDALTGHQREHHTEEG